VSEAKTVTTALKSTPYIARLSLSLMWLYLTLGYRVRKTRVAFEKQLVAQGMSKQDAKRLSASFDDLKNEITGGLKQAVISRGR
jgi:hypothetical protein